MKVVIDDGSNYIKIAYKEKNKLINKSSPSRVRNSASVSTTGDGYSKESFRIGDNKYSVTNFGANVIPTNSKDYQTSEHNRVLIHHALRTVDAKSPSIAVTIPLGSYYTSDSALNNQAIKAKAESVKGAISYLDGSSEIAINEVFVLPEGIPAFVHASEVLDLKGDRFLLIDVGGTTTDIAILTSDNQVEKSFSLNLGSLNYLTKFNVMVCEMLGLGDDLTDDKALKGLMTGELLGEDVSSVSKSVKSAFSEDIKRAISNRIGETRLFDSIVLSGGGSVILDLPYKNSVRTDYPQFDNANGMMTLLEW